MILTTVLSVVAVVFLVAVAMMMREVWTRKPAYNPSMHSDHRRPKGVTAPGASQTYDPTYCYNDCMRVHGRTDRNFPCLIACNVKDGSPS
jgi:hypothetical protein